MKERLLFIDVLKILGISLIITQHVTQLIPGAQIIFVVGKYSILLGSIGVMIFLVASGAGLTIKERTFGTWKEISSFYKTRILRIYPIFFIITVVTIIYMWFFHAEVYAWQRILVFLTGFQAILGDSFGFADSQMTAIFWFIGLIIFCYLLYPYLLAGIRSYPHITLYVASAITLGACVIVVNKPLPLINWYTFYPCWLVYFVLGIFLVQQKFYPKNINHSMIIAFLADISFYLYITQEIALDWFFVSPLLFIVILLGLAIAFYFVDQKIHTFNPYPIFNTVTSIIDSGYKMVIRFITK